MAECPEVSKFPKKAIHDSWKLDVYLERAFT